MYEQIEQAWTADAKGYDALIQRQLSRTDDVAHWQRELNSALGGGKNLRVLDVGCGPGFFSIMLARLGHRVTSVDGAQGMVDCAARNFAAEGIDVNLYCGDAVALEREEPNSFDAIVSRDVVWTLYDPRKAYARWMELLKPGGRVVVFDGNYRRDRHSLKISAWKTLGKLLTLLIDGKPKKKNAHGCLEVFTQLPSVTTERPQMDQQILSELGFKIITLANDDYRNSPKRIEFWKYGYQGKKFEIVARKPL